MRNIIKTFSAIALCLFGTNAFAQTASLKITYMQSTSMAPSSVTADASWDVIYTPTSSVISNMSSTKVIGNLVTSTYASTTSMTTNYLLSNLTVLYKGNSYELEEYEVTDLNSGMVIQKPNSMSPLFEVSHVSGSSPNDRYVIKGLN